MRMEIEKVQIFKPFLTREANYMQYAWTGIQIYGGERPPDQTQASWD